MSGKNVAFAHRRGGIGGGPRDGQVPTRRVPEPLRRGPGANRSRMGCSRTNRVSRRPRLRRRMVGQLSVVRLQYTAYGLAVLVRCNCVRTSTGSPLPCPQRRPCFAVGGRSAPLGSCGRRLSVARWLGSPVSQHKRRVELGGVLRPPPLPVPLPRRSPGAGPSTTSGSPESVPGSATHPAIHNAGSSLPTTTPVA